MLDTRKRKIIFVDVYNFYLNYFFILLNGLAYNVIMIVVHVIVDLIHKNYYSLYLLCFCNMHTY